MSCYSTDSYAGASLYDRIASFYDKSSFFNSSIKQAAPEIGRMIKQSLPEKVTGNPKILDLCCGTGELAQALQNQGYQITGLDGSEEMLRFARQNAPDSEFVLADIRSFHLPSTFHGVISTNLGLNYVLNIEELISVFENVYDTLLENGFFMFDLRMDEHCHIHLQDRDTIYSEVKDDYVWTMFRRYNYGKQILESNMTIFELVKERWKRSELNLLMKCYFKDKIRHSLENIGFTRISISEAADLKIPANSDRSYVLCHK